MSRSYKNHDGTLAKDALFIVNVIRTQCVHLIRQECELCRLATYVGSPIRVCGWLHTRIGRLINRVALRSGAPKNRVHAHCIHSAKAGLGRTTVSTTLLSGMRQILKLTPINSRFLAKAIL